MKKNLWNFLLPALFFLIIFVFIYFFNFQKAEQSEELAQRSIEETEKLADIVPVDDFLAEEEMSEEISEEDTGLAMTDSADEIFLPEEVSEEASLESPRVEQPAESSDKTFVRCLADKGVVIYGSYTCPACSQLANNFGGYEAIDLIYVECSDNRTRCSQEMQTNYIPEIQIKSVIYQGSRTPAGLSVETGCQI